MNNDIFLGPGIAMRSLVHRPRTQPAETAETSASSHDEKSARVMSPAPKGAASSG